MRTKSRYATIAVIPMAVVVLALLPFKPRPGVDRRDFELLQAGMMQGQAERLLHGPPRNDLGHTATVWLPRADGRRISAWIEPVSPAVEILVREDIPKGGRRGLTVKPSDDFFPETSMKDGRQEVWVTSTGLIAVFFGRDGVLLYKYMSTVHESAPPSALDWIASRPRMIRQSLGF